ncbi:helix-turn-helix transcriptional regulator [Nonomuraea guangzhouensis]|uniref:LuxR C-terminal-related transcriptional regulator n=1 Tax=Nonomuraea guangzhouensis TaxID=1291555 RepID=A0ABW4GX52_9ACTN|nr:LuxR C-terminal-related transcriptional regulator [Nonomuraea guangzhouensis]
MTTRECPAGLAGRGRELVLFDEILDEASPAIRAVQISGDPFVGKTSLLHELIRKARERRFTVVEGKAKGGPLALLTDAFDPVLADLSPNGFSVEEVAQLARISPALGEPARSEDMYGLCHAMRILLDRLAGSVGLLLALDDVHRADTQSLAMIDYLLRHPPDTRVIFALAYRTSTGGTRITSMLRQAGHRHLVPIEVKPLSDTDVERILPSGLDPIHRHLVSRDALGNPGLLQSMVQGGVEQAYPDVRFYAADDLVRGTPPAIPDPSIFDFSALSALAWRVACAAAINGDLFEPSVVAAIGNMGEDDVLAGIDELQREGIVSTAGLTGRLRFHHPITRALIYHAADGGWSYGVKRRTLDMPAGHRPSPVTIASCIEQTTAQPAERHEALVEAARATLFTSPASSARWMRNALSRCADTECRLLLGKALTIMGRLDESRVVLTAAWPHLDELTPEARADAVEWCMRTHRLLGRHAFAMDLAGEAFSKQVREVGVLLESAATLVDSSQAAEVDSETMLHPALTHPDPLVQCAALSILADASLRTHCEGAAALYATEAGVLVDAFTDEQLAAKTELLHRLGTTEMRLGWEQSALAHLERGFQLASSRGQLFLFEQFARGLERAHRSQGADGLADRFSRLGAQLAGDNGFTHGHDRGMAVEIELDAAMETVRAKIAADTPVTDDKLSMLSSREAEVAVLVSTGCTNQQIARRLRLSHKTVETYLSRIFKKLEIYSRAQIAHIVGQEGAR